MKIKVSEATPLQINWMVAKCKFEGSEDWDGTLEGVDAVSDLEGEQYSPSTNWSQGGPILERGKITVEYTGDPDTWCACIMADQEVYGPTPLIAAMRCFCVSKLGEEVDVPDELCAHEEFAHQQRPRG